MKFFKLTILLNLLLISCHPLSVFHPQKLIKEKQFNLVSQSKKYPKKNVKIIIDNIGIPHIYGNDEADLAYGLGFMHASDRLFQLDIIRHAAQGRLTELFGKELLSVDKKLRILNYGLQEQFNALSKKDKKILKSYAAGVNHAAKTNSTNAQYFILGIDFEEFTPIESLSITRFQSWDLANDLKDEIARYKLISSLKNKKLSNINNIRKLYLEPISSGGVPIVNNLDNVNNNDRNIDTINNINNNNINTKNIDNSFNFLLIK